MASTPIHGMAERYVYRPVFSFYVRAVKVFSLGAMLAILTLPVFPVLNYYAYLFLAGLESLPVSIVYDVEVKIFWQSFIGMLILYVFAAGAFRRLGLRGVISPLNRIEPQLRNLTKDLEPDALRNILVNLAKIPFHMTLLALMVFILQIICIYLMSIAARGDFTRIRIFMLVDGFILVILAGLVYSLTEFCCGYLRMQVKRQLSGHNEAANDLISGKSGVIRFLYLLFIGGTSTIALIFFLHNKNDHVLWHAIQFSGITFLICATLAFIYFYTWTYSLHQINEATYNVAMGGRGNLPMLSNDREMVELAVNFDAATYEINTIRNYLTELVDEKTKTISEAYNELKQLKSRQDGDYYLTSNLIESLTEMRPESDTVTVDSLIKQFKNFDFLGHNKEIGGDMNAGYALRLQGEKYTLVVNADAMGKSLQGAGGVLVLGSALRSLIERTQIHEGLLNLSPERWLKNSFLELHRLFSSFNGSMMASMVCLLIHDKSGYTVMINAEHPKGILLRGAQAEFISNHEGLRKLGNNAVKGRLWVDTFVMKHRDIVILGSDGRDDLVVAYDGDNQPIMNEDEKRILQLVRAAGGDLPRIYLGIRNAGEIVDDISLMRVEFNRREGASEELAGWRSQLRRHIKDGNLPTAAFTAECLVRIQPERDFFLYTAALLYYRVGNLEKALNYCDRLTLRNWHVEPYLVLLGKIYEGRQDERGMVEAGMLLVEIDPAHAYGKVLMASRDKNL